MVCTNLLQYSITIVSIIYVGHLGELELSSASIATSFASVTGYTLLVKLLLAPPPSLPTLWSRLQNLLLLQAGLWIYLQYYCFLRVQLSSWREEGFGRYLCLIVCLNSARFFCGARTIVYLYYKLYQDFAMDDVCRVEETLINNCLCWWSCCTVGHGKWVGDAMWASIWSTSVWISGSLFASGYILHAPGVHSSCGIVVQYGVFTPAYGSRPRDFCNGRDVFWVACAFFVWSGDASSSSQVSPVTERGFAHDVVLLVCIFVSYCALLHSHLHIRRGFHWCCPGNYHLLLAKCNTPDALCQVFCHLQEDMEGLVHRNFFSCEALYEACYPFSIHDLV